MIKGIAHVCYTVTDIEKSILFYTEKLGFRHAFDFRNAEGVRTGVYLKIGDGRSFIELFQAEGMSVESAKIGFQHLCLETEDIEAARAELNRLGVETTEPLFAGDNAWQIWITDPDGNRIEIHQYTDSSLQSPFI